MTPETFANLKRGAVIRHKLSAHAMTVQSNDGEHGVLVTRWTRATNPDEWLLIGDDGHAVYDEPEPA